MAASFFMAMAHLSNVLDALGVSDPGLEIEFKFKDPFHQRNLVNSIVIEQGVPFSSALETPSAVKIHGLKVSIPCPKRFG